MTEKFPKPIKVTRRLLHVATQTVPGVWVYKRHRQ